MTNASRIRRPLRALQHDHDNGKPEELDALVRAWAAITALAPDDPRSFFRLGGYHGEPFVYRDDIPDDDPYWGGYCNHGNVLFPTWHRVYVLEVENALRSFEPTVTMPFWDETSDTSMAEGIPTVLTDERYTFADGTTIDNPLRSFTIPEELSDKLPVDQGTNEAPYDTAPWAKPAGYETVRYPFSGLVGTPAAAEATATHNAPWLALSPDEVTAALNKNVVVWLNGPPPQHPAAASPRGVVEIYADCLDAPNYTVFSNSTSRQHYNDHDRADGPLVTALEDPHNDVHLAVGGFDITDAGGNPHAYGIIQGANGDMGENNTAGLDPIFFFHHCHVDRMFWLWQQRHHQTEGFDIEAHYPGTDANDSQGPTPGVAPGTQLDLDSPLTPFVKADGSPYTSRDCFNIVDQMDYDYQGGSLPEAVPSAALAQGDTTGRALAARGVDRAEFDGSFVLLAYADTEEGSVLLGHQSVLSRRDIINCANCLSHLEVKAHFSLDILPAELHDQANYRLQFVHRGHPEAHIAALGLAVTDDETEMTFTHTLEVMG